MDTRRSTLEIFCGLGILRASAFGCQTQEVSGIERGYIYVRHLYGVIYSMKFCFESTQLWTRHRTQNWGFFRWIYGLLRVDPGLSTRFLRKGYSEGFKSLASEKATATATSRWMWFAKRRLCGSDSDSDDDNRPTTMSGVQTCSLHGDCWTTKPVVVPFASASRHSPRKVSCRYFCLPEQHH